jgi:hypothetical protein
VQVNRFVIPAKAEIQTGSLVSRLRGNDEQTRTEFPKTRSLFCSNQCSEAIVEFIASQRVRQVSG